ncbi:MAG: PTS transporter subunit EIIB [Escherichia coli]|nr:PTS transporter subunit EIIB [Escherichia coli]
MAKNYAALARSVIAALGGVDNISAVTHCMTRLRFVIKDDTSLSGSRQPAAGRYAARTARG